MTTQERRAEFDKHVQGSVELGRELVQNALYRVLQPINERYIDGRA